MDIGALKQDDFQVWVPFQEDAEVLVRYISLDEVRQYRKKATVIRFERRQKVEDLDADKLNHLFGSAAVRGWKGITMDGEEFPYSQENCDFLMTKWGDFADFVAETCMDLQALQAAEQEQKLKNS